MVSRVSPKKRCQEGRLAISGNNGFGGYFCEAQAGGFQSLPVKPIPEPTRPKAMNITPKTMQDLAVLVG